MFKSNGYQRQKASCLIVSLLFLFELDLNLVCEGKGQRAPTTALSCDSLGARVVAVHAARMHTRLYAVPKYTWRRLPAGIVRRPPVTHKGCQTRAAHAASPPAIEARAMPRHATARTCVLVLWICFILFLLASALRTFLRIASCRAEGEPRYRSVQVNAGRFGFGWGSGSARAASMDAPRNVRVANLAKSRQIRTRNVLRNVLLLSS